jgi:hypothetical protein
LYCRGANPDPDRDRFPRGQDAVVGLAENVDPDQPLRVGQQIQCLVHGLSDYVAGQKASHSESLLTHNRDAQGGLFQHSDVVHSVSDGDHAGDPELLDKRCFLASFVAGRKAFCFGMKLIGDRIELT